MKYDYAAILDGREMAARRAGAVMLGKRPESPKVRQIQHSGHLPDALAVQQ